MENNCEIAYIYGLIDPRDGEIRYIGKTKNPKTRLSGHITESKKNNSDNYRLKWLRKLSKLGLSPGIIFLKICQVDDFEKYETEYIKKYSNNRLTNSDDTGQGNKNRKREILDRQSQKLGKKVFQYELNGIFIKEYRSARQAASELKTNHANIVRCCNGLYKHTLGFIFSYEKKDVIKVSNPNAIKKSVIEIDEFGNQINIWISLMDCSKDTGIDNGNLSRVCNGKISSIKSRYFKFKNNLK